MDKKESLLKQRDEAEKKARQYGRRGNQGVSDCSFPPAGSRGNGEKGPENAHTN